LIEGAYKVKNVKVRNVQVDDDARQSQMNEMNEATKHRFESKDEEMLQLTINYEIMVCNYIFDGLSNRTMPQRVCE